MSDIFDFIHGTNRTNREKVFDYIRSRRSIIRNPETQFAHSLLGLPIGDWRYIQSLVKGDLELAKEVAGRLALYTADIPFVLPVPDEGKMHVDFKKLETNQLKKVNLDCVTRGEPYISDFEDWVYNWDMTGVYVANAFMQDAMCNVSSHLCKTSIYEGWQKESFRKTVFRNMLNLGMNSNIEGVFTAIKTGLYFPSNFRPTIAKEIYNTFGLNKPTVLDFSSGFAGRFTGFWASDAQHYIGIDPNTALIEPYRKLSSWLQTYYPKKWKSFEFVESPAEDVDYSLLKGHVGLVFTSPPYFDIEQYSTEETQSFKRYNNVDLWRDGFLKKVLGKISYIQVKGDFCIVNICDSQSREYKLCDYMVEFMGKEFGYEVLKGIRMLLAARPGKAMVKGRVAEPIFIFRRR